MHLKVSITTLFLFVFCYVNGQNNDRKPMGTPEEMATETLGKIEEEVELTNDQRKGVYDIHVAFFTDAQEAMKQRDKEKMEELETVRNERVKELLGKKLYRKYITVMESSKPQRPSGGRPGGRGGMRGGPGM
ncbi:hypothetical protein [Flammeovirga agarivorans]|uniref:Uncharacterized protein n=1 Tax=Flammeovirga agarivorans TaxID=2726742 RepID=A0A7X8SJB5_9BACT|nr:hypothetical protein [Flammeovirga agarivorans]NLR91177.1 hypothetical protein [Flammeovirga agarivorans]